MAYAFEKNPQRGRPKGAVNKTTRGVRLALQTTFDRLGGVEALAEWAQSNPTDFYKLYAKLLPIEVRAAVEHEGSVTIVVDTGISRAPDEPLREVAA